MQRMLLAIFVLTIGVSGAPAQAPKKQASPASTRVAVVNITYVYNHYEKAQEFKKERDAWTAYQQAQNAYQSKGYEVAYQAIQRAQQALPGRPQFRTLSAQIGADWSKVLLEDALSRISIWKYLPCAPRQLPMRAASSHCGGLARQ